MLAGLEEEAKLEAEEAARRQYKRAQRSAKKKEKAAVKSDRTEPEPELEPEPQLEHWPPPEDDINGVQVGHGSVLRPLSGSDAADTPDGTPFTMVMAVPSAQQPLLTVTATAAVSSGDESLTSPEGVTEGSTGQDPLEAVPDGQHIESALAAPAVAAEGLEEVEAEEVDDAAGVGLGLKDSFSGGSRADAEEQQAEIERMLADKAAAVASMDLADADAAFAAAAEDARGALNQEMQRLSQGGEGRYSDHLVAADLDEAAVREAMRTVYEEQEELLARAAAAVRSPSATTTDRRSGSDTVGLLQEMHQQLLVSMTTAFERRLEAIVSDFERRIATASAPARSTVSVAAGGTGGNSPIAEVVRAIAAELELGKHWLDVYIYGFISGADTDDTCGCHSLASICIGI